MKLLLILLLLFPTITFGKEYVVKFATPQVGLNQITTSTYLLNLNEKEHKNLIASNSVIYAEPNYTYSISANPDPLYKHQWGLSAKGINAKKAWKDFGSSSSIIIGVIDTGVDINHQDLTANIWVNEAEKNGQEGIDDDNNGYIDDVNGYDFYNSKPVPLDDHGHGTHCAGVIGALHNDVGVKGVLSSVKILPMKFLSKTGSGTLANAVKAIDYAIANNVGVLSLSWGSTSYSRALEEAFQRAKDAGIISVAAAGNSSVNNDERPHYPSNFDSVISVASLKYDKLSYFSNYGESVHIAAPGSQILSTVLGGYKYSSGTSMAAPHVSAAVGLLLHHHDLNFDEVLDRIITHSVPLKSLEDKILSGGKLDLYKLLRE